MEAIFAAVILVVMVVVALITAAYVLTGLAMGALWVIELIVEAVVALKERAHGR